MKFRCICLILAVVITLFPIGSVAGKKLKSEPLPFDDIEGLYEQEDIVALHHKGIISGAGHRTFEPKRRVTRAEFITMLIRLCHLQPVDSDIPAFDDVPRDASYYGSIQAAILLDWVQGTGERTFEPERPVSYQEAVVIICRVFKQSTESGASGAISSGNKRGFRPGDLLTRQQTAGILHRVLWRSDWSKALAAIPPQRIEMAWQYNLTTQQYMQKASSSHINTLSPRWYFLNSKETISDHTDKELITWAKQHGKKLWPLIGNKSSAELTHKMLTDPSRKDATISKLVNFVKKYELDGLNLDFENVYPKDREALTEFVQKLADKLHQIKAVLSVDVSPDLGTDWTEAFDYAALGEVADYMVLMGYDEHWSGAPTAGPVSSFPWFQYVLDKLLQSVPAHKVIVALPLYTRDWSTQANKVSSRDMTLTEQGKLLRARKLKWDDKMAQYVADFSDRGVQHQVWVEDSRSLAVKYALAGSRRVAGFAYWYVGDETNDIWKAIENSWKYLSLQFSEVIPKS